MHVGQWPWKLLYMCVYTHVIPENNALHTVRRISILSLCSVCLCMSVQRSPYHDSFVSTTSVDVCPYLLTCLRQGCLFGCCVHQPNCHEGFQGLSWFLLFCHSWSAGIRDTQYYLGPALDGTWACICRLSHLCIILLNELSLQLRRIMFLKKKSL